MSGQTQSDAPVGVVVVTHTEYGAWLLKAAEFILGPQEHCRSVSVDMTHPVDATLVTLKAAIKETDRGAGVLILTDMFGGTPSNLAISVMEQTHAEVIAGLNLPMLIKLASVRGRESLEACVAHAQDAGRKYISVASWVLAGEK